MTEPTTVGLALYVGEDWVQQLTFFDDAPPVPDPPVSPLALDSPVMAICQTGYSTVLAEFNVGGTGLGGGTCTISGGDANILTLKLPYAWTYKFQGMGSLSFDIFDTVSLGEGIPARRVAIAKGGLITVTDATTEADGT